MEEFCRNCRYFKAKGLIIDRNTWGFCKWFTGQDQDKDKEGLFETGVFRWGDAVCANFKTREESKTAVAK